jgi:hypothetical protein
LEKGARGLTASKETVEKDAGQAVARDNMVGEEAFYGV